MDILINTDEVLRDIVLNKHIDLRKKVTLKKPKFVRKPIDESVNPLFSHNHSLLFDPETAKNVSIDLSKLEFKGVSIPGVQIKELKFAPDVRQKKRIFLDNLKDFNVGTVNLLSQPNEEFIPTKEEVPVEESEEKKQASEFLRKTFKNSISDFGSSIRNLSLKLDKSQFRWAHLVPSDKVFEINPRDMALKLDFKLDTFQSQAIHYLSAHKNVFVAAHTSSGKTVIAEYAIALSDLHNTNTIYTSPIKALSNQKYRDFSKKFSKQKIGLITGDVQINVNYNDAGTNWIAARQTNTDCSQPNICTIMTTEILLTMLYRNEKFLKNVEYVVFDECHYINDDSRGYVWEEIFILLPSHITIVMLSATIPNLMEFNEWIGELKNREIYIVKTDRRPIPLEYYCLSPQFVNVGKFQKHSKITQEDQLKSGEMKDDKTITFGRTQSLTTQTGNDPFAVLVHCTTKPNIFEDHKLSSFNSNMDEKLNKGRPMKDAQLYLQTVRFLSGTQKLPVVVFVLSRKKCDDLADSLFRQNVNLLNSESERHFVNSFLNSQLSKLTKSISGNNATELPRQVQDIKNYLLHGYACHHSGLLQSLKEIVELLFQMGYVKLLFATETFAIGVNMPTRTVVFDSIKKYDGRSNRLLTPVEFTQMAGRAGRRGQDDFGTVILLIKSFCISPTDLRHLCLTNIENVKEMSTKFQLNYKLLLNVIKSNEIPEPQKETFKQQFEKIANEQCCWNPKVQTDNLGQASLSIEKFLKFNFFEYKTTLKGVKIDNHKVDIWSLLEIILNKRFFGYFNVKQIKAKSNTFYKDIIKPSLIGNNNTEESHFTSDYKAVTDFLILAIEFTKFNTNFWLSFLNNSWSKFCSNGRLIRVSHQQYHNRFGICVGNSNQSKKVKLLIFKNSTDNDKDFLKWLEGLKKSDNEILKKITKFLNKFGCQLWDYRQNKGKDDVESDDYEDDPDKTSEDFSEEDTSLLEILNSFLQTSLKITAVETTNFDGVDWQRVLRFIFNTMKYGMKPKIEWPDKDSILELIEVDINDVVAIYDVVLMAKHDLSKPDNFMKLKLALEKELTSRDDNIQLPWWDSLRASETAEEDNKLIENKLLQKQWFEQFLEEKLTADLDVLQEHFCVGQEEKSIRFLQMIRARYERRILSHRYQLENLQFYRSYQRKLRVLERLEYVRPNTHELTLKGRMASELSNQKLPNELLLTEIIFNYFVVNLTEAELCALLSCALCRAKIDDTLVLELYQTLKTDHSKLWEDFLSLEKIYKNIQEVEKEIGADMDGPTGDGEKGGDLNYNLILVVYEWAQGKSFIEIKAMTEIQDGIIVRCIQDLIELLRDIRNAAHSVGEPVLFNKINAAINLIKRDIIFAPSLYTL